MTAFADIAAGRSCRLVEAALEFALDEYPELSLADELAKIERLRQQLRRFATVQAESPSDELSRIGLLNRFFFGECRFRGASRSYYNPKNSYLNEVLNRRKGIPITLSVVYADLAEVLELDLHGVNLPGHFVLGLTRLDQSRVFIDVFNGGALLDWNGCLQRVPADLRARHVLTEDQFPPMEPREVVGRMLRNLKGIFGHADLERAMKVQQRLVELFPLDSDLGCELAELFAKTKRPALALKTLQAWLRRKPELAEADGFKESLRDAARESALAN